MPTLLRHMMLNHSIKACGSSTSPLHKILRSNLPQQCASGLCSRVFGVDYWIMSSPMRARCIIWPSPRPVVLLERVFACTSSSFKAGHQHRIYQTISFCHLNIYAVFHKFGTVLRIRYNMVYSGLYECNEYNAL